MEGELNKGSGYYHDKDLGAVVPCNPDEHRLFGAKRIALEALISIAHEAAEVEPEGSGEAAIWPRLEIIERRVRALFCIPAPEEQETEEDS